MSQGFAGTSMDNLATAANVSKATLYSHFADKSTLYRAIIEGKVKDYRLQDFQPASGRYGMQIQYNMMRYGAYIAEATAHCHNRTASSDCRLFCRAKRVAKKISVVRNKKRKLSPVSLSGIADTYRL